MGDSISTWPLPISAEEGRTAALAVCDLKKDFSETRPTYIEPAPQRHFDQAYRNSKAGNRQAGRPYNRPLASYGLTPREAEIAYWLSRGKTNSEIAVILRSNTRTVEKHLEQDPGKVRLGKLSLPPLWP